MVITEEISAVGLAKLFRDNIWKLYGLPKSMINNRRLQFITELTRELCCSNHSSHKLVALTSVKLSVGYLVVGFTRELNKEPSLHCYSIYMFIS